MLWFDIVSHHGTTGTLPCLILSKSSLDFGFGAATVDITSLKQTVYRVDSRGLLVWLRPFTPKFCRGLALSKLRDGKIEMERGTATRAESRRRIAAIGDQLGVQTRLFVFCSPTGPRFLTICICTAGTAFCNPFCTMQVLLRD